MAAELSTLEVEGAWFIVVDVLLKRSRDSDDQTEDREGEAAEAPASHWWPTRFEMDVSSGDLLPATRREPHLHSLRKRFDHTNRVRLTQQERGGRDGNFPHPRRRTGSPRSAV